MEMYQIVPLFIFVAVGGFFISVIAYVIVNDYFTQKKEKKNEV